MDTQKLPLQFPPEELIHELVQLYDVGLVEKKDKQFVDSLLKQFATKGMLSTKQWAWVRKMIERAVMGSDADEEEYSEGGRFSKLIDMFKKANQHLKYPKIKLKTVGGLPVCLSLAGKLSKKPGTISITDGKQWPENLWYGYISTSGEWVKGSNQVVQANMPEVKAVLLMLMVDPEGTAAKHGIMSGKCCFCNAQLDSPKSTLVGYGPVCASHFGLKWGQLT